VANIGGNTWWQTFTLRLRAQRAWNTQQMTEGKPHQARGPSMNNHTSPLLSST
jgi:hypothetical protein